ncbi:flagellar basal-body rod protein FlgG [Sphingomonas sp. S17]|jgi:flagellar basal-body rod protein FlgG|uniref:Flagellar basal-body rod protein FlgG n=3 Tax=Sphingomonas TaxID=13687 RepID=A0A411LJZ3_SPHPI|nr:MULTISPECIES: flagellar basal-body rod protein FlgG [Sphingomonas]EGI54137.1 flagellar basal-body rod protein FlgG [Sphingomonas sp. S17]MBB3877676.1 flagellar basal-body rod protein FlgG [Sphingomonas pseudosanguinis]MBN3537555.1 flagellar basal-body rod protein FlgG [Sphingomonas pseudosanguinis]MBQ1480320.1 flagellar basal-body rod protein FlgG [Sphingomonas sp.]MCM3678746.1 flagellar basal-body rod protein FlgG [Sphingomonas paucimobilis]
MSSAAMHIARTGLDAQDMRMRVISNNLANVNTTGFKRDRAAFETLAYQTITAPGAASSTESKYATGLNLGTGVRIQGTARINTQGAMQTTNNSLDMALDGEGFFQVQMPGGTLGYTRAGNFSRSAEGLLVTSEGYQVMPGITVPEGATQITIGTDGTVSATIQGQTAPAEIGQIQIATFPNPAGLQSKGDNYLTETAASGAVNMGVAGLEGRGQIRQGMLEGSNVNVVEELVDMIETQRAYEVNSKMIKSTDEMLQYANQNL